MKTFLFMMFVSTSIFAFSLNINPVSDIEDVQIDTVLVEGIEYHKIILETYPLVMEGQFTGGLPSLPYIGKTFLLPPDTEIDNLTISHEKWTSLPGKYYLYPCQEGVIGDTTFTLPDSIVYSMETPFPEEPIAYPAQGSAMGYSIATVNGTPVRYTPADSLVEVLTRMRVSFDLIPSTGERIAPLRETELSAEVRQMNILGLVANPELISMYESPEVLDRNTNFAGLNIFDAPSPEGDGVDMVIITSGLGDAGSDLTDAFQELADYRTSQGIVTVVRTIGWIESTYSGCDTPQKIRNFIRDAHENWGIQAVILGGDDWIVPVRYFDLNSYHKYYAADDYYADIDGDWTSDANCWSISGTSAYIDILVGRLPVDDASDVQTILDKIVTYETQPDDVGGFCRSLLLMASNEIGGSVGRFQTLKALLVQSGAVTDYLNTPLELYWKPDTNPSLVSFTRSNVLQAFDTGYNLTIHCDHSDIHEIGAGGNPHLSIHDYDFNSMSNQDRTGILWTNGCWPGCFAETECFAEAGLLTDTETGFTAIIANTTSGTGGDEVWSHSFCDALYSTGWTQWDGHMPLNWPLSYLGQAFRHQKNFKTSTDFNDANYVKQHLFGDPFMFVWRDNPSELSVAPSTYSVTTGTQTISVAVTEEDIGPPVPVADAIVCIWNQEGNDVFAIGRTNSSGVVVFTDLEISQTGLLTVTATKRRDGFDVAAFLPDTETITVTKAPGALVCIDNVEIDDDNSGSSQGSNDGVINPGETIELNITAANNGSSAANYVTAELNVVSGAESIASIPTSQISFPNIPSEDSRAGNSPFVVTINENVESYSSIEFEIEFSYNFNQTWNSPYFCSVLSENYSIPLIDFDYAQTSTQVTIDMTDFLLVNSGTGAGLDLGMTVSDIYPSEPFICNTVDNLGALSPDECLETSSELNLVITPANPRTSPWTNQSSLDGCTFDIQITSNGGEFTAKRVDFDLVRNPGIIGVTSPPYIVEADDNSLEFEWAPGSTDDLVGFYMYFKKHGSSSSMTRSTSLPIPVGSGQLSMLDSETQYIVDVTAVDAIGRESTPTPGEEFFSTTCEVVNGWPVQLEGGTGTGPVIINMDGDAANEIVVASSFGNVYIIQSDGQTECILPPSSLDFDRFVSLAVGDVDNDSENEIIISCQKDIVDGEVVVLLYNKTSGGIWQRNILDDTIGPNETVCGATATGTPVILEANDSSTLEVALRTKGTPSSLSSTLHLWQWSSLLQDWIEPTGFPISLTGNFFSEPIAVDFDDDGYDELIVSQLLSNGYSSLHVVDFNSSGFTEYDFQLTDLDTDGRVYSTLAAVEYNGEVYVTGVARYTDTEKKLFVYDVTGPNTGMIWYSSNMQSGHDSMGNMGGPAIGHANADGVPDIFYALNGMSAWELLSEQQISNLGQMDENAHSGVMKNVKSSTIAAGTSAQGSIVTVPFVGFSSKFYSHDPLDYMDVLPGFPTWTETASWTSPAVGDVDGDGFYEVLTANGSGELTLYDWNGYSTSNSWPMYQHDPHRTGFFNSGRTGNGFDIELLEMDLIQAVRGNPANLLLSIEVTGVAQISRNHSAIETVVNDRTSSTIQETELTNHNLIFSHNNQSNLISSGTNEIDTQDNQVTVAVYSGRNLIATGRFPITEGIHEISIAIPESYTNTLLAVIDPGNMLIETDETNNSQSVESNPTYSVSDFAISFQSPSDMISATVFVPDGSTKGISFSVYSADGRLQSSSLTQSLAPGTHRIDLSPRGEGDQVPSGVYFVHINIVGEETIIRRVVLL